MNKTTTFFSLCPLLMLDVVLFSSSVQAQNMVAATEKNSHTAVSTEKARNAGAASRSYALAHKDQIARSADDDVVVSTIQRRTDNRVHVRFAQR
ncbi:MAG: hypothetical protein WC208_11705 [Gallionella sp.]|jgi:hypothetical protein